MAKRNKKDLSKVDNEPDSAELDISDPLLVLGKSFVSLYEGNWTRYTDTYGTTTTWLFDRNHLCCIESPRGLSIIRVGTELQYLYAGRSAHTVGVDAYATVQRVLDDLDKKGAIP